MAARRSGLAAASAGAAVVRLRAAGRTCSCKRADREQRSGQQGHQFRFHFRIPFRGSGSPHAPERRERNTRQGLNPKVVFQSKYRRLEAQAGMQLTHRSRRKLRRHVLQWRGQPDDVHLHVEARLSLLRNLLDALRCEALRCATVRWRAAGHVCRWAMHSRNHGGAGSCARDHPQRDHCQCQQAQDAAMSKGCHFSESIQRRPGRK